MIQHMDFDSVWVWLGNNTHTLVMCVVAATLWYTIYHNRKEKQENTRSALKRIHDELKDTLDAIKNDKGVKTYTDPERQETVMFLKLRFHYDECEDLIKTPEVRGAKLDVNKIKDVIGIIKENNRIFEWIEREQPLVRDGEKNPVVEHDTFLKMWEDCKKMNHYQERLREDIPPILQKIKEVCDQLG